MLLMLSHKAPGLPLRILSLLVLSFQKRIDVVLTGGSVAQCLCCLCLCLSASAFLVPQPASALPVIPLRTAIVRHLIFIPRLERERERDYACRLSRLGAYPGTVPVTAQAKIDRLARVQRGRSVRETSTTMMMMMTTRTTKTNQRGKETERETRSISPRILTDTAVSKWSSSC